MPLSLTFETVLEVPGPEGALSGVLLKPPPPIKAFILIVPGSGPVDRDGNGHGGLETSIYQLLANGLAAHGIATVRVDKRGMHGSSAAVPDADSVTIGDYGLDVQTWVSRIQQDSEVSCVYVLGHSEGGLVALLAAQGSLRVSGLILVATAGRPLASVLRTQLRSNPANGRILDQALSVIARLETGRRVDTDGLHPALLRLFRPAIQEFLLSEIALDPARLIETCKMPILILQGDRDIQVSVEDAELLARANKAAKLRILPNANHVLKAVYSEDRAENLATYHNRNLPLAAGVIDEIVLFVDATRRIG